jgi:uncharacterized protein YbaR (Trm112 family)
MSIVTSSMTCPVCRGELYADRRSVADLAEYGYRGGRITCQCGGTSIWLCERKAGADVVLPTTQQRGLVTVRCQGCRKYFKTKGTNAKRCSDCRTILHRLRVKMAQRSYIRRRRAATA